MSYIITQQSNKSLRVRFKLKINTTGQIFAQNITLISFNRYICRIFRPLDVDLKVATCPRTQVKNGKVLIDLTLDEEVEVPTKQVVEVVDLTKDSDTESESREEIQREFSVNPTYDSDSLDSTHTITKKSSHSTTDYSSSDNHWTTDSDSDSDVSRSSSIGFRFYSGLRHWMISPTTHTDVNTNSDDQSQRKTWINKESNTSTYDITDIGERLVLIHYHYFNMTENSNYLRDRRDGST